MLPRFGFQTSEATLSLAAEEAQPPPDRRPGRSPLAVAALAQVNFQPLPSSVVTLSQAQIAKIKG